MMFLITLALMLAEAPVSAVELPPPPAASREVFAGDTYTEVFQVTCIARGTGIGRVTVDPRLFQATLSPSRITPGTLVTLTAPVPITTPSQPYRLTLEGIRTSGDCASGGESISLFVKRPVRLEVRRAGSPVFPGQATSYGIFIRRRMFAGPVTLRTSGLPDGFRAVFTPETTDGTTSDLTVQAPAQTDLCAPPSGCVFQIRGMADVQVESIDAKFVVKKRSVSLAANPTTRTAAPGIPVDFPLTIVRDGYTGPVDFDVATIQQPSGGRAMTRIIPDRATATDDRVTFEATIDPTAPGVYRFRVTPRNSGVAEFPIDLTVDAKVSTIVVSPSTRRIHPGQNAGYTIDTVEVAGERVTVTGVRVEPEGAVLVQLTDNNRGLLATTSATTPARTYKIIVDGLLSSEPVGVRSISAVPVDLVVEDLASQRVIIDTDPRVENIEPGQSGSALVQLSEMGGFRGSVTMSVIPMTQGGITASIPADEKVIQFTDADPTPSLVIDFQAAPNARPSDPLAFIIAGMPSPAVPINTATAFRRVISPSAPAVQVEILVPPGGFVVPGGQPIPLLVRTSPLNGCTGVVEFETSSSPAGALGSFSLQPIPLTNGGLAGASITTTRPQQPVNVRIVVKGKVTGCRDDSDSVMGRVDPPPPEPPPLTTSTLAPASQSIQRGQSASYSLVIARGGVQGPLNLAVTGLPSGITAAANPNPVLGDSSQITLTTGPATPAGTFPFMVTISANGTPLASAAASVMVMAPPPSNQPTIASFSPSGGAAGTQVQIFGTNLNGVQNVLFSNNVGAAFAPISSTQVNATVPGLAVTGPITVIASAGTVVSGGTFVVSSQPQAPQVTGFTPTSGGAGTSVRIQGVNLGGAFDVGLGTPAFGFMSIGFTPFDATRIDALIPNGVPSGFFRVSTPAGTATSANAFNVTTPTLPEIGGFNPAQGPPGTRVEIIGSNLGGATSVTFGGAFASFEPPQPTRIFATVPPNAMTGQIRVTTPNGTATSFASFAVTSAGGGPVITDFQPRMGSAGFSVTIAGANLGGTTDVTFNGVHAQIGIITPSFVQVFVPTAATTGLIRLTTPNGSATSPFAFTVQP
jgi:hypothetical protein